MSAFWFRGFANCPATVPLGVPVRDSSKGAGFCQIFRVSREVSRCPAPTVQLVSRLSRFFRNGTAGQHGKTGQSCGFRGVEGLMKLSRRILASGATTRILALSGRATPERIRSIRPQEAPVLIAGLEIVNRQGDRALHQNQSAYQPRSGDSQDNDNLGRSGTALVRPESMQETNCPPHIQSPACRCHVTTRFGILWPIRPAPESESRIGPINRALTRARCELWMALAT